MSKCKDGKQHDWQHANNRSKWCARCWVVRPGGVKKAAILPAIEILPLMGIGCLCQVPREKLCPQHPPLPDCTCHVKGKRKIQCAIHLQRNNVLKGRIAVLIARDGPLCAYCGVDVTTLDGIVNGASVDHKIPRSRQGSNAHANLVLSCRRCNEDKSDMTDREYQLYKTDRLKYKSLSITAKRERLIA